MASALQKYLRSEYSHSVHGGVSSLLAVVSSLAHQHVPQECTAVPGPSSGTIPHTTGPSSTVHCRPPWQCSATETGGGGAALGGGTLAQPSPCLSANPCMHRTATLCLQHLEAWDLAFPFLGVCEGQVFAVIRGWGATLFHPLTRALLSQRGATMTIN